MKSIFVAVLFLFSISLYSQNPVKEEIQTDTIIVTDTVDLRLFTEFIKSLNYLGEQEKKAEEEYKRITEERNHFVDKFWLLSRNYADPQKIVAVTPEGKIIVKK